MVWNVKGLNNKDNNVRFHIFHILTMLDYSPPLETKVKSPKMGDLYLNLCPSWCLTSISNQHPNGIIVVAWLFMLSLQVFCIASTSDSLPSKSCFWN